THRRKAASGEKDKRPDRLVKTHSADGRAGGPVGAQPGVDRAIGGKRLGCRLLHVLSLLPLAAARGVSEAARTRSAAGRNLSAVRPSADVQGGASDAEAVPGL